jgi:hypothetical protein
VARSRREFLRDLWLATAFAAGGVTLWWRGRLPALADQKDTLVALVETLLPTDDTPGALALGVHDRVFAALNGDPRQTKLARAGIDWCDRAADGAFALLPSATRNEIVARAAAAERGQTQRDFFDQLRHLTLGFYLAHPESQRGLRYAGPPLPAGYADQALPPQQG